MSQLTCFRCGALNGADSRYCVGCGTRLGGEHCCCGQAVAPDARFCSGCGGRVTGEDDRPLMAESTEIRDDAGVRWLRAEHDLASRITPADLSQDPRGIEVQAGTRGLLFHGGRYVGTLPPGRHSLESVQEELGLGTGEPSVIVVDDGEIGLELEVDQLRSVDPHGVELKAQVALRLVDPELFLANLLRDRSRFSVGDLSAFLDTEIRGALAQVVATLPAADLDGGRARSQLEMELLSRWKGTFERCGFVLQRFKVLQVDVPSFEAGHRAAAEAADRERSGAARRVVVESELKGFELDADLLRRRGEGEANRDAVAIDLELRRLERDVERLEARGPLIARLQEKSLTERMARLRGEEEWRKLQLEVDRDRLLAAQEWASLEETSRLHRAEMANRQDQLDDHLKRQARQDLEELDLKQKYRLKLLEMRGDTEVSAEVTRRSTRQVEEELVARRLVFEQELDERRQWSNQGAAENRESSDVKISEVERLENVRQQAKDREVARRLQDHVSRAEVDKKRVLEESTIYKDMTPEQIMSMTVARHPERATELAPAMEAAARSATSERLLSEVKEATSGRMAHEQIVAGVRPSDRGSASPRPVWQRCAEHEIKYPANASCPLCRQEG